MALDSVETDTAFVRLSLDPTSGQPVIDNVPIHATPGPEPGATLMSMAGLLTLWALRRRRS